MKVFFSILIVMSATGAFSQNLSKERVIITQPATETPTKTPENKGVLMSTSKELKEVETVPLTHPIEATEPKKELKSTKKID
jgi:hypothetical protein